MITSQTFIQPIAEQDPGGDRYNVKYLWVIY